VFSFHPVKSITTGEGGAILTNDDAVADRAARLRSHGITRDPAAMTDPVPGPWYYEQQALGFNHRMTDLQAALGLSQLGRLDGFVAARRDRAAGYDRALGGLPVRLPPAGLAAESAHHLYPVEVAPGRRRAIFERLQGDGIGVNVHYIPIHTQPFHRALGTIEGPFPNAERYYAGAITLPLFPTLDPAAQDHVIASLTAAVV